MTVDELRKKVLAAELKVEKCTATIERHKAQMAKKAQKIRDLGVDPETADKFSFVQNGTQMNHEMYWLLCEYDSKKDDIKGATKKLEEAQNILTNWQHKLDVQINKENLINDEVPQILKDFLENWKTNAFKYYVDAHKDFVFFRKQLRAEEREARLDAFYTLPEYEKQRAWQKEFHGDVEPDEGTLINMRPHEPMENYLKERELDYRSIKERLRARCDWVISKMCEFKDDDSRNAWLDKTLEEEKKAKLLDLYNRATDICGPIGDASGLRISESGDLDGFVYGEKGVASIKTIGAGGYNIQCYHYRTLVKDVTEKMKHIAAKQEQCGDVGMLIENATGRAGGGKSQDDVEFDLGK